MWKKLKFVFQAKQNTLYSSTLIVALTLFIVRVLGLIKLRILTGYFSNQQLDLFFAAFRLPDFIFEVFVAGSIAACFIPIIIDIEENNDEDRRRNISTLAQTLSLLFLIAWLVIFVVVFFLAEDIIRILVPGYSADQVSTVSKMSLTILFLQVPFLFLGNVLSAILQTEKRFLIPGIAPAFYNLGVIVGVILWTEKHGLFGAIFGVALGSVFYLVLLLTAVVMLKYQLKFSFDFKDNKIANFLKLFWPRLFSSITAQIDATVDLALSTLKGVGSYSSFYLARNLQILPVSFLGIAISQTALPFFSTLYSQKKNEELLNLFIKIILQIVFVMMPFVIIFTALRLPIIRLFFGSEKFTWEATVQTANILSVFAISLPFHTTYYVITRIYFAIHDTKTPFITGVIFTLLNSLLSFLFVSYFNYPVWYLALSFTISISLNSTILFYIIVRRLDKVKLGPLLGKLAIMAFNTLTTIIIVWLSKRLFDGLVFDTSRTLHLFLLTLTCVFIGMLVYLYLSWVFVSDQLKNIYELLMRHALIKATISRYRKMLYPRHIDITHEDKVKTEL